MQVRPRPARAAPAPIGASAAQRGAGGRVQAERFSLMCWRWVL